MPLAVFDLDNTLLAGDSDHAWGEFLVLHGYADPVAHAQQNDAFYQQYLEGRLDINAYVKFTLGPVLHLPIPELESLHRQFMAELIRPMILPRATQLIARHKDCGDFCLIMSATNRFITQPIADALGVHDLLATDLQVNGEHYTGEIAGTPCFQAGKVDRLREWLQQQPLAYRLDDAVFYSDSFNDVPLLETVGEAVAVDPDPRLASLAAERAWKVISLREG